MFHSHTDNTVGLKGPNIIRTQNPNYKVSSQGLGFYIIIPLCPNELRIPGTLSCTGGTITGSRQSDGLDSPIFAYFRVVLRYFCVNILTIYAKIMQNRRKKSRCHVVNMTITTGRTKVYDPPCSPRRFRLFFAFI